MFAINVTNCLPQKEILVEHMKTHDFDQRVECDLCGKCFRCRRYLNSHRMMHLPAAPVYACNKCERTFSRKANRDRHTKICLSKTQPGVPRAAQSLSATPGKKNNEPGRPSATREYDVNKTYMCPVCNAECKNRSMFVRHMGRYHTVQAGAGPALQDALWTDDAGRVNEPLRTLYNEHRHEILLPHYIGEVHADFNFSLPMGQITYQQMRGHLVHIYETVRETFKVNISFGVILRAINNNEKYRYYHPMETDRLMDRPFAISSRRDIDRLLELLQDIDILENMVRQRKNTKWVFHQVANVVYYVNKTNYVLGSVEAVLLPEYILNNRAIVPLVFDDHLCLFRCLGMHRGHNKWGLGRVAKQYLTKWTNYKKLKEKDFKGVSLKDLRSFEKCFSVNVNVYSLNMHGIATLKYDSPGRYSSTLSCNLFGNHLSFIKNFKKYASKYQCEKCSKHFPSLQRHNRHAKKCSNKGTTFIYPGGYMKPPRTLFDELEDEQLLVPERDRYFRFFAVFDFEALLLPVSEGRRGENTIVTHEHRPISVSTASNITLPGCRHSSWLDQCSFCERFKKPECIIDTNVDSLMERFVRGLTVMQEQTYAMAKEKYAAVFEKLKSRMTILQTLLQSYAVERDERENLCPGENEGSSNAEVSATEAMEVDAPEGSPDHAFEERLRLPNSYSKFLKKLCQEDRFEVQYNQFGSSSSDDNDACLEEDPVEKCIKSSFYQYSEHECQTMLTRLTVLQKKLETYCSQLPVLGFNSGKYDVQLIKQKLVTHLNLIHDKDKFVVKKGNCYVCIANGKFKFLDITQFVAPGYSYEKFIRSYDATEGKGFLPYEYLTSADKLDEIELPPPESFYSTLKRHNVLEAQWLQFHNLAEKYQSEEKALKEMGLKQAPCTLLENYKYLEDVWKRHKMRSMHNFLCWYNNLDVGPFVEAVQRMLQFYLEQGIDFFKENISIPGVAIFPSCERAI